MPDAHRSTTLPLPVPPDASMSPPVTDGTSALAVGQMPLQPRPALSVVPAGGGPGEPPHAVPPPPVRILLRGLLEVLSGWRPAAQVALRVSPEIAAELLDRPRRRSATPPPAVLRTRVLRVADDVVETCAVLRRGQRCGALAMRLEFGSRGWLVTRLQVG